MLITSFQLVTVYLSNIYVFTNCPDAFLDIRTGSVRVQPADKYVATDYLSHIHLLYKTLSKNTSDSSQFPCSYD